MRVPRAEAAGSGGLGPVLGYGAVGAGIVLAGAAAALWLASPDVGRVVAWTGVGAYAVQLPAFIALWVARDRGSMFFVAWGGGTVLRLGVVGGAGVWLARAAAVPPAPLLLGLVGFLFVLLLLEPLFFYAGVRKR